MDGRSVLYTFFLTGEKPTQGQFQDLIDSCFNLQDDTITVSMVEGLSSTLALLATSSSVAGETTRAEAAEATLGGNITAETTRAEAAEATLSGNVTAETTRAESAETTLAGNITAETTRAEAAEATLASAIAAETTRAEGVEANKVDVVSGYGLSQNNFSNADQTKLAGLSNYFMGVFASAAALATAYPTGTSGDYAFVASSGVDAAEYIWDSVNNLWVAAGTVTSVNSQTGVVSLSTDNIGEGSTNKYFTAARVLATLLSGYTSGAGTISSSDSVLSAIQKLNGNIAAIPGGVWGAITGALSSQTDLAAALALLAPLASPALTGNPTAPTQSGTDSSTKLATTAFVQSAVTLSNSSYKISYNFSQSVL